MNKIEKFEILYKNFGIKFAINYTKAYIYMRIFKKRTFMFQVIEEYIENNFKSFIDEAKSQNNIGELTDKYRIWVCWLQGEENMPEVVKVCYRNLRQKITNKEIVLITLNNLKDYVEFPDYIYEKFEQGKITPTHLSDIIRVALLSKYGGMWIDSTIFITNAIKNNQEIFDSKFFTHKILNQNDNKFYSQYRWSVFLFGTKYKNNDVFILMYKFWLLYWRKYDILLDYWLLDFIIGILYKNNILVKECVDDNKENNIALHYFKNKLDKKCCFEEFNNVLQNNCFFKLTYKENIDFNKTDTNFAKLSELSGAKD